MQVSLPGLVWRPGVMTFRATHLEYSRTFPGVRLHRSRKPGVASGGTESPGSRFEDPVAVVHVRALGHRQDLDQLAVFVEAVAVAGVPAPGDAVQAVAIAVSVLVVAGPAQAFRCDVDVIVSRAPVSEESQVVVALPESSQHLLSLLVGWVDVGQHANYVIVYQKGSQSPTPTVNSVIPSDKAEDKLLLRVIRVWWSHIPKYGPL